MIFFILASMLSFSGKPPPPQLVCNTNRWITCWITSKYLCVINFQYNNFVVPITNKYFEGNATLSQKFKIFLLWLILSTFELTKYLSVQCSPDPENILLNVPQFSVKIQSKYFKFLEEMYQKRALWKIWGFYAVRN